MYYIWSIEHNAWWKPAERGYSKYLGEAGQYPERLAIDICRKANFRGIAFFLNEIMVPVDVLMKSLERENG